MNEPMTVFPVGAEVTIRLAGDIATGIVTAVMIEGDRDNASVSYRIARWSGSSIVNEWMSDHLVDRELSPGRIPVGFAGVLA